MEWEVLSVFVTPPKLPPERAPRRRPLRVGLVGRWMGGWLGANPLRVLKQVPFVWVSEFHTNRPQCQWGEVVGRGSKKKNPEFGELGEFAPGLITPRETLFLLLLFFGATGRKKRARNLINLFGCIG